MSSLIAHPVEQSFFDDEFHIEEITMPNGDFLSLEELRKHARPINAIKAGIDKFANKNNMEVFYHRRGRPHVELKWQNTFALKCTVYLSLDDDMTTYKLGIGASQRDKGELYWKTEVLHKGIEAPFEEEFIVAEIKKGVDLCNSWKFADLSLAKKPKPGK